MAEPPATREGKRERIAEWILLSWLRHFDPNILGLRRVDENKDGRPLRIVHIAIPLDYRRKQLAQTLGISRLADERKTPRANLIASAGWNKPHSYIRVPADFFVSQVLDAIKERVMRPSEIMHQTIQPPQGHDPSLDRSLANERDENSRLRSAVREGLAKRNASIEPHQIQILTHKETGEKWIRILHVDRGQRTTFRLAIKRAGINALLALNNDAGGPEWSIRFAATETSKLLVRSPDSFDILFGDQTIADDPGNDVDGAAASETAPTIRLFSAAKAANSLDRRGRPSSSEAPVPQRPARDAQAPRGTARTAAR
jgi:hypothetical protein